MTVQFHSTGKGPFPAKRVDEFSFKKMADKGVAVLFDVETNVGGFRVMHAVSKTDEISYLVLFFPDLEGEAIPYSLQLKDFHMLTSFYLIGMQVPKGEVSAHPHENLAYNLMKMVEADLETKDNWNHEH